MANDNLLKGRIELREHAGGGCIREMAMSGEDALFY
jgi:hypothetical protein